MTYDVMLNMYVLVTAVWCISILVVLIGIIPYAIWVARTAVKRRWKKFGLQLAIPIVASILLIGLTRLALSIADDHYLQDLYDTEVDLGLAIFEHNSTRSFNGDGDSISVYHLPNKIRSRFESVDKRLLTDFPKLPSYRDNWKVRPWREAPFDEADKQYLDFALFGASGKSKEICKALSRKGTYYAFFYYNHGDHPGNIDFFIVDLVEGRLYSINVNT